MPRCQKANRSCQEEKQGQLFWKKGPQVLTRTNVLFIFRPRNAFRAAQISTLSGLGKEYLMINSLAETNTITVTFQYQRDFIKSAIAWRVLRAPLHCEPIWAVVMAG